MSTTQIEGFENGELATFERKKGKVRRRKLHKKDHLHCLQI
jgi:hypothetical protein